MNKLEVAEGANPRVLKSWEEHAKREITRFLETENVTDIIGDCMKDEYLGPFTKFLYWFGLNCKAGWGVMVDFGNYIPVRPKELLLNFFRIFVK